MRRKVKSGERRGERERRWGRDERGERREEEKREERGEMGIKRVF